MIVHLKRAPRSLPTGSPRMSSPTDLNSPAACLTPTPTSSLHTSSLARWPPLPSPRPLPCARSAPAMHWPTQSAQLPPQLLRLHHQRASLAVATAARQSRPLCRRCCRPAQPRQATTRGARRSSVCLQARTGLGLGGCFRGWGLGCPRW